jgi:FAD-dependent oxidoreductase domain-containing protein 1
LLRLLLDKIDYCSKSYIGTGTVDISMADEHEVLVVGSGILGLASAYHLLRQHHHGLDLSIIDMFGGAGRGNTARSAAAFRDLFTSPVNRRLAQGSIHFYENIQQRERNIGLRNIGYLWLMTETQFMKNKEALEYMAHAGVVFEVLDRFDLAKHLFGLELEDIDKGILGARCGILNQNNLVDFYYKECVRMGAKVSFDTKATGLVLEGGEIVGVKAGSEEIRAKKVLLANGAWMGELMGSAGIEVPVVPKKRQLFSVRAKGEALKKLYHTKGFSAHSLIPFTIVPEGAYLRPAANSFILGYADEERKPGIEDTPKAEREFFDERVLPQVAKYFPAFKGAVPEQSWAGHYNYHPPDNLPFVEDIKGAILIGGDSGSGIMKADSIGRIAAGVYAGRREVELGDDKFFLVEEIGLHKRALEKEEFII